MFHLTILLVFPLAVALAGATDLFTMTIPNRITLAMFAAFFLLAPFMGFGLTSMGWHVLAFAAALAVTIGMFAMGWMGGGDAKLIAVVALWFGFENLLPYLAYATLFGGMLASALLGFRALPLPVKLATTRWIARLHDRKEGIPYGIALAGAALVVYPETRWMASGLGLT